MRILQRAEAVELEFRESMSHRLEKGYLLPGQTSILYETKDVMRRMERPAAFCMCGLDQKAPLIKVNRKYNIMIKNVSSYQSSFEELIKDLKHWKRDRYRVVLLSNSGTRAMRLAEDLKEYELDSFYRPDFDEAVNPRCV